MPDTLQFISSFHIFLTLLLSLQIACSSSWPATLYKSQSSSVSDLDKLRKQVERFAVGEGNEKVYLQLEQLPRNDLISDLDKLKKQAAEDDSIQVKIAFLFCRLDYHYEENREMIARSLTRNSPYYKLPPDETIGFASYLIKRGDKQLPVCPTKLTVISAKVFLLKRLADFFRTPVDSWERIQPQ